MNTNKVYVDVTAVFSKEGQLKPVSVKWQDGHIYEIQRITDIRRAASLKAGGVGMRYTCIIDGKETHLFYEEREKIQKVIKKVIINGEDNIEIVWNTDDPFFK